MSMSTRGILAPAYGRSRQIVEGTNRPNGRWRTPPLPERLRLTRGLSGVLVNSCYQRAVFNVAPALLLIGLAGAGCKDVATTTTVSAHGKGTVGAATLPSSAPTSVAPSAPS